MRKSLLAGNLILMVLLALILVPGASAASSACNNRVNNNFQKLLECITLEGVREHQAALQAIADDNGGNRFSGLPGHDASVDYVVDTLEAAGYDPIVQEFDYLAFNVLGASALEQTAPTPTAYVEGTDFQVMDQSDGGDVTAAVTAVDVNLVPPRASTSGCEAADFAGFPAGDIALLQRGTCTFESKAENAAAAGAVGAILFNQGNTPAREGLINGTLGATNESGIPVVEATYARGEEWATTPGLTMHIFTNVDRGTKTTFNVFAETPGRADNVVMVGGHLDSVRQGPGIQDNGTGSAAILELAEQMAKVKPRNMVRFAWWGAEESGLVGSTYYVDNLSEAELDAITLYLNFDMVGSPNHVFFIYDGDDSDGEGAGPGPEGSAQIEATFEAFFDAVDQPFKGTDFSGRSDYGPFIAVGIPAGGLFTGAEGIKTAEEAALWGGTAGEAYDACYHQACDTYDNVNLTALDVNADAIGFASLQFAMSTENINGERGKGNFNPDRLGDHFIR
ncbi:MAG: lieA [Anaerolineales bacterium]|nr:lieA [Anaerolineales bacterium]MBM2844188.1 lieA [Anaerolineales bacterium]